MDNCVFCKILARTIPIQPAFEDDLCIAFPDINPQAPKHLLIIPRQHFADVAQAPADVLGHLLKTAANLGDRDLPDGYRIVANTGANGGQTVPHLHLHLLGGRPMTWPPG